MHLKRIFIYCTLLFSFICFPAEAHVRAIDLSAEEVAFIKAHPVIRVGNETNWPPFDFYETGKPKGLAIEHIELLAEQVGLQIEFVTGADWNELINQFKRHEIDVLPAFYKNAQRSEFSLFTKPYYKGALGVFAHKQGVKINSINDLLNKRVGIQKGHGAIQIIKKRLPAIGLIEHTSPNDVVKALATQQLDAIIGSPLVFGYFAQANQVSNIVLAQFLNMNHLQQADTSLHIAVRKDYPELQQILNKAMQSLSSKEKVEIVEHWEHLGIENKNKGDKRVKLKLSEQEQQFIQQHPEVVIGSGKSFAPFIFQNSDGTVSGYEFEIAHLISQRTGLKFRFEFGAWKAIQEKAKQRQLDGLSTGTLTPERASYYLPSTKTITLTQLIIVKKGNPLQIKTLVDLSGKRVAMQRGNGLFPATLKRLAKDIRVTEYDGMDEVLLAIATNEVDYTILDESIFYLAKVLGLDYAIESAFFVEKPFDLGFLLRNDWPELQSIVNKGLQSISTNERLEIRKRWFLDINKQNSSGQSLDFTKQELRYLAQKIGLKVCVDPFWAPYDYIGQRGKHQGMSVDYLQIFSKRLGVKTLFYPTASWEDSLRAIKERRCDFIPMAKRAVEQNAGLNMTESYFEVPYAVATAQDAIIVGELDKEMQSKVAVVRGYINKTELIEQYPLIKLIEVSSPLDGLLRVNNGEVFAYIGAKLVIKSALANNPELDIKIAGQLPLAFQLGIASRSDEPLLGNVLQKVAKSLTRKETSRINHKWQAVERVTDYTLLWQVLAVMALVFGLFMYWNRKLSHAKLLTEAALAKLEFIQHELEDKNKQLEKLSVTDRLTQIYNRTKLDEVLNHEFLLAERHGYHFGVIMVDIDYFKQVNDIYGHPVGDQVLIEFSNLLKNNIRAIDTLGRWGGEEFLIICPETDKAGLYILAEDLRAIMDENVFSTVKHKTASFGATLYHEKDVAEKLMSRVDEALYKAKEAGRNRVEIL